jgi:hypothetical protein
MMSAGALPAAVQNTRDGRLKTWLTGTVPNTRGADDVHDDEMMNP